LLLKDGGSLPADDSFAEPTVAATTNAKAATPAVTQDSAPHALPAFGNADIVPLTSIPWPPGDRLAGLGNSRRLQQRILDGKWQAAERVRRDDSPKFMGRVYG